MNHVLTNFLKIYDVVKMSHLKLYLASMGKHNESMEEPSLVYLDDEIILQLFSLSARATSDV